MIKKRRLRADGAPIIEHRAIVKQDDGCWLWTGVIDPRGHYGMVTYKGRTVRIHRAIYEELRGSIPPGTQLDHLCRNMRCCNPDHLEPVTGATNVRMGRVAKLNESQVKDIRTRLSSGASQGELAKVFGVCFQTISKIALRQTWKGVEPA